jgi:hypothetical protein
MLQMKQVCKRVSAVPLMALVAAAAHAYFWVIPPAYENTNVGDGLNTIVRNAGNPRTYQMIVHASQLTGIAVGDQIVGITFRLYNGAAGSWPSADVSGQTMRSTLVRAWTLLLCPRRLPITG